MSHNFIRIEEPSLIILTLQLALQVYSGYYFIQNVVDLASNLLTRNRWLLARLCSDAIPVLLGALAWVGTLLKCFPNYHAIDELHLRTAVVVIITATISYCYFTLVLHIVTLCKHLSPVLRRRLVIRCIVSQIYVAFAAFMAYIGYRFDHGKILWMENTSLSLWMCKFGATAAFFIHIYLVQAVTLTIPVAHPERKQFKQSQNIFAISYNWAFLRYFISSDIAATPALEVAQVMTFACLAFTRPITYINDSCEPTQRQPHTEEQVLCTSEKEELGAPQNEDEVPLARSINIRTMFITKTLRRMKFWKLDTIAFLLALSYSSLPVLESKGITLFWQAERIRIALELALVGLVVVVLWTPLFEQEHRPQVDHGTEKFPHQVEEE